MTATYTARFERCTTRRQFDGLCALNFVGRGDDADRDDFIRITAIRILPGGGFDTLSMTAGKPIVSLARVSGIAGGRALSAVKADSAASNLPSQVTCIVQGDRCTIDTVLRPYSLNVGLTANTTGIQHRVQAGFPARYSPAQLFQKVGADLEPVILREGESLAVVQTTRNQPMAFAVEMLVVVVATGANYLFRNDCLALAKAPDEPLIALTNGAGSGVVLQVQFVLVPNCGGFDSGVNSGFRYRLAMIERRDIGPADARDGDIVAHDSANAVPTGLRARCGPFLALLLGESQGAQVDWHTNSGGSGVSIASQHALGRRRSRSGPEHRVDVSGTDRRFQTVQHADFLGNLRRNDLFPVLRRGQGIALLGGDGGLVDEGAFGVHDIEIEFTYHRGGLLYSRPEVHHVA